MMHANEAKKATNAWLAKTHKDELDKIETRIVEAVQNGNYEISFNGGISNVNKEYLEHLDYVVSITSDQREGTYTSISW